MEGKAISAVGFEVIGMEFSGVERKGGWFASFCNCHTRFGQITPPAPAVVLNLNFFQHIGIGAHEPG